MSAAKVGLSRLLIAAAATGGALGVLSVVGEGPGPRVLVLVVNLAAPWAVAALGLGLWAGSARWGAMAGGVALLVGMATFYMSVPPFYFQGIRGIIWTVAAAISGPIFGWCGGFIREGAGWKHTAALAAPSATLLAEALWVSTQWKAWRWNLSLEPHRFNDLAVLLALLALAVTLPLLLKPRHAPVHVTYLLAVGLAILGAVGFSSLQWVLLSTRPLP